MFSENEAMFCSQILDISYVKCKGFLRFCLGGVLIPDDNSLSNASVLRGLPGPYRLSKITGKHLGATFTFIPEVLLRELSAGRCLLLFLKFEYITTKEKVALTGYFFCW